MSMLADCGARSAGSTRLLRWQCCLVGTGPRMEREERSGNSAPSGEAVFVAAGQRRARLRAARLPDRAQPLGSAARQVAGNDDPARGWRFAAVRYCCLADLGRRRCRSCNYFSVQISSRARSIRWFRRCARRERRWRMPSNCRAPRIDLHARRVLASRPCASPASSALRTPGPPSSAAARLEPRRRAMRRGAGRAECRHARRWSPCRGRETLVPRRPPDVVLAQLHAGGNCDPTRSPTAPDSGFGCARVSCPVHDARDLIGDGSLPAAAGARPVYRPLPARSGDSVQGGLRCLPRTRVSLREPPAATFIVTLSLVLLFGVLGALSAAVYFARKFVQPIAQTSPTARAQSLAEPVRQTARAGDQLTNPASSLPVLQRDDAQPRQRDSAATRAGTTLEDQRAYLETIARAPVLRRADARSRRPPRTSHCDAAHPSALRCQLPAFIGRGPSRAPSRLLSAVAGRSPARRRWRRGHDSPRQSARADRPRLAATRMRRPQGAALMLVRRHPTLVQAERDAAGPRLAPRAENNP